MLGSHDIMCAIFNLVGGLRRFVRIVIGLDLDRTSIAWNRFQSSLIASTLRFCKVNRDYEIWVRS